MESIKKGYIQFVPVCSWCGAKIEGPIDVELPELLACVDCYKQYAVIPPQCPCCGVPFHGIMAPKKLPFDGY